MLRRYRTVLNSACAAVVESLESRCLLSQSTLYPTDDSYVRDGSFANVNYGAEASL